MERTISGMMGKGSDNHNIRAFYAENVDSTWTKYNVEFYHENIKEVYHRLFDEALERYNAKQKRNDRKINNYYKKIERSKQEKLFHEVILQIGNKNDMNAKSENGQLAKKVLVDFMKDFQERNPHLYVFSAHLHMDEETPHVHIDFVPFIHNSKRGLDTRVSLKGALAAQGFYGGSRSESEWNQWMESEKQELSKVMERYGIQWKHLGTHNKHLSVLNYKKQEREKEVAELEQTISGSKEELSDILHQQVVAEQETEQIRKKSEVIRQEVSELSATNHMLKEQMETLTEDKKKLLSENEKLGKQQKRINLEISKMVQSKEIMERNIHVYDEDVKWQLSEPGMLMSAKAYREKNVVPLVTMLKDTAKSLTIKCVKLTEENKKLKAKVTKQAEDVDFYKSKIHQQYSKLEQLQEKADDFERVKQYVGADKIDTIVTSVREREMERIVLSRKQHSKTYGISR